MHRTDDIIKYSETDKASAAKANLWAYVLLLPLLLGGCGIMGPAHNRPSTTAAAIVDMGFMSFEPAMVTIRPGETVEWRNTSLITHTVTDSRKQGAAAFNSKDIAAGQTYRHTFSRPGTYHYLCEYHEKHGMVGTVIVGQ